MQKKLTMTLDEQVYEAYLAMAADEQREADAREWVENLAADAPHEAG